MRKIVSTIRFDEATFQPILTIKMNNDGVSSELFSGKLEVGKYTAEETAKINLYNKALIDNDLPLMTVEEEEWALGKHLKKPDPTTEELERLAGFKVEKKIIYLDKKDESNELA
jgi:hypothetical protein